MIGNYFRLFSEVPLTDIYKNYATPCIDPENCILTEHHIKHYILEISGDYYTDLSFQQSLYTRRYRVRYLTVDKPLFIQSSNPFCIILPVPCS